jgi:ribonucleoside-diphosphate reductase alpha chain
LWRRTQGADAPLPEAFLTASQVEPVAQLAVVAAVAPYVDGAISKTLALPEQADAAQVRECIVQAWRAGLKGLTVFRDNPVTGSVFSP